MPGRTFTRRMYQKLKIRDSQENLLKQYHHVNLGKEFLDDWKVWKFFLTSRDPTILWRPFVDFGKNAGIVLNFYSDALLNSRLGMGAVFENRYIVAQWDKLFIQTEKPSIEFLELFALVAAVITWSNESKMLNSRVEIFCDNESVKNMVNGMTSGCMKCMKLIRILAMDNLVKDRLIKVHHVRSKDNYLADALSRLDFPKFWKKAPETINRQPDVIANVIWPPEKVWFS